VAKQHYAADGQLLAQTRFAWDGMVLAEQAELTPDGERCTTWDYEPGTFTPLAQRTGTSLRDAPQDEIDRQFRSIITDLTGTPSELIADDGTLAGRRQAVLWGGTAWQDGGDTIPLRFPGQYEDQETGLFQNGQRYYDPVTGTYVSPDPLGIAPSLNPYRYVFNPHLFADPLGLEPNSSGSRESSRAGKWTGQGEHPLEDTVANAIEDAHPGLVEGMGRKILREDGSTWSDHDVYGKDFVIEVASGKGKGKTAQIGERVLPTAGGARVAVYGPAVGVHVTRGIEELGVPVFRDIGSLVSWVSGG
jgi:RHS repeat-associated protein